MVSRQAEKLVREKEPLRLKPHLEGLEDKEHLRVCERCLTFFRVFKEDTPVISVSEFIVHGESYIGKPIWISGYTEYVSDACIGESSGIQFEGNLERVAEIVKIYDLHSTTDCSDTECMRFYWSEPIEDGTFVAVPHLMK